ncbi:thymidylate synthase [Pseudoalteromonas sp. 68 DY56-GL68]|uniref:thymidylate synthase n=1 Tax=Pseudoalteromonas sp. 68 DY56-GL68 TaxID=2974919 RepID=UPI00352AC9AE
MSARHIEGETVDDILMNVFDLLRNSNRIEKATKGEFREFDSCLLTLNNPMARLSRTELKETIFSCLGELFWYLSGSDDESFISYYLSVYKKYAENDGTINGAYGKRLFSCDGKYNQFSQVISLLKSKPSTRQAVVQLFSPKDTSKQYKDTPCTLSWQFMIRENKLHMYTTMRSNDAYRGLPHDIFVFTMLQELVSKMLGIEVGAYHHYVSSLHLYTEDVELAERYIQEGYQKSAPVMGGMPAGFNLEPGKNKGLIRYERLIREGRVNEILFDKVPEYWQEILRLLEAYNIIKQNLEGSFDKQQTLERLSVIRASFSTQFYREIIDKRARKIQGI